MQWHVLHLGGVLDAGAKYIVTRAGKRALVTGSTSSVYVLVHKGGLHTREYKNPYSIFHSSKVPPVHIHRLPVVLHLTLGYISFSYNHIE